MKSKSLISWLRPFTEALYRQGTSIKLHKGRYNVYNNDGSFIIAYPDRASAAAHAREIEVREWYKRTTNWIKKVRKNAAAETVKDPSDVMQMFDVIERALNQERALLSGKEVAPSQVRTAATEEVPKVDNSNPIDPTKYIERPPVKPIICIFDIPIKDTPPAKDVTEKENMPFADHPKTGYEGNMKYDENVTGPNKNPYMKDSQNPDPAFGEGYLTSSLNANAVRFKHKPQELTPEQLQEKEKFQAERKRLQQVELPEPQPTPEKQLTPIVYDPATPAEDVDLAALKEKVKSLIFSKIESFTEQPKELEKEAQDTGESGSKTEQDTGAVKPYVKHEQEWMKVDPEAVFKDTLDSALATITTPGQLEDFAQIILGEDVKVEDKADFIDLVTNAVRNVSVGQVRIPTALDPGEIIDTVIEAFDVNPEFNKTKPSEEQLNDWLKLYRYPSYSGLGSRALNQNEMVGVTQKLIEQDKVTPGSAIGEYKQSKESEKIKEYFINATALSGHPMTEDDYNRIAAREFSDVPKDVIQTVLSDLKKESDRLIIYPDIATMDRVSLETKDDAALMRTSDILLRALESIVNTVTSDLKNVTVMQNEYLDSIKYSLSIEDTIVKRPDVDPGFLANMREDSLERADNELQKLVYYKAQVAPLLSMQSKAKDYINKINEIIYQEPSEKSEFGLPEAPKTPEGIQSLLTSAYDLIDTFKTTYEPIKTQAVDFSKTVTPFTNKRYDYIKDVQRHVKPARKTSLKTAAIDSSEAAPQLTEEDIAMIDEIVAERRRELSEELKKKYVSSDIAVKGPDVIGEEINAVLDAYLPKFKDMLSKRVLIDRQKGIVEKVTTLDIFMHKHAQEEEVPEETEGGEYEETPTALSSKYDDWETDLPSDVVNKIHDDLAMLVEREQQDLESRGYSPDKLAENLSKFENEQLTRMIDSAYSEYAPEVAEEEISTAEEPEMAEVTGVNVLLDKSVEKADVGLKRQLITISQSLPAYTSLAKDDKEEFDYVWNRVLSRVFPYARKHFYSSTSDLLKTLQKEFNYAIEERRMGPRSKEERKRHLLKSETPLSPEELGKRKEQFMTFVYDTIIASAGDSDAEVNSILSKLDELADVISQKNAILRSYPGVSFGLDPKKQQQSPYMSEVAPMGGTYEEHYAKATPETKSLQDTIALVLRGMDIASNRVTNIEKEIAALKESYNKPDLDTKIKTLENEIATWSGEHSKLGATYEQLMKKLEVIEKTKIEPAREKLHGKSVPKKTKQGFDSLIERFNSVIASLDDPVYRYFIYRQYDMLLENILEYTEGTKPETTIYEPTKRQFPLKSALNVKEFSDYITEANKSNVNEVRASWIFEVLESKPEYEDIQTRSAMLHEALAMFDTAKFNIINRKDIESAIKGLEKAE